MSQLHSGLRPHGLLLRMDQRGSRRPGQLNHRGMGHSRLGRGTGWISARRRHYAF